MEEEYYYMQRGAGIFVLPAEIDVSLNSIGWTWQDYLDGAFVRLIEGQIEFMLAHPAASVKEVYDMELAAPPVEPPSPPPLYVPYDWEQVMEFNYGMMEGLGIPPKEPLEEGGET